MKAKELDKRFDSGSDICQFLDMSRAKRTHEEPEARECGLPSDVIRITAVFG
jgi:biotin operon repressor